MTTKLYRGSGVKDAHTEINPILTGIEKERTQCIQVKQRPSNKQQKQTPLPAGRWETTRPHPIVQRLAEPPGNLGVEPGGDLVASSAGNGPQQASLIVVFQQRGRRLIIGF